MLTVISDLHFEEEARDTIADRQNPANDLRLRRNLTASAFRSTIADLAAEAERNRARQYGDEQIVADPDLRRLYVRLLEFDDVRPQSALLPFLLSIPDSGWTAEKAWSYLEPVVCALLDFISDDAFFRGWLRKLQQGTATADVTESVLNSKPWRFGLSLNLMSFVGAQTSGAACADVSQTAAREEVVRQGTVRFVIAGHTHEPQVAFIDGSGDFERYYVDTGTWRMRVLPVAQRSSFAAVKSLTYVTVYASTEDQGRHGGTGAKRESFDYWSGFTQRWR
jgi:hypothetical protein